MTSDPAGPRLFNPHSALLNPQCHNSLLANTIAPIIATSNSIDAISNGIR